MTAAAASAWNLPALLLAVVCVIGSQQPAFSDVFVDHLNKGFKASSIDWVDANGFFLYSANRSFALGFCKPGSTQAYFLCVEHFPTQQIVWTANRNTPVAISDNFMFENDGNVSLYNTAGVAVWTTQTANRGAELLQLQESGNLVVLDGSNRSLWESFDHPTDTLLLGQRLNPLTKLVSSISATNLSEGRFSLQISSNSLFLFANFSDLQPYWSMATDIRTVSMGSDPPAYAALAAGGILGLYSNSSILVSELVLSGSGSGSGSSTLTRAVLDGSGNLITSFYGGTIWSQDFVAVPDGCSLPAACGQYGICSNAGQCRCPQLLNPINGSDVAQGCRPPPHLTCPNTSNLSFQDMGSGLDYFSNQFSSSLKASNLRACQDLCMKNCSCSALFYLQASNDCYLVVGELGSLQFKGTANSFTFLKIQFPGNVPVPLVPAKSSYLVYVIGACAAALVLAMISIFAWWFYRRRKLTFAATFTEDDGFLQSIPGLPARFSYKQLQTATNNFSLKLGTGGFGSVYEGILPDKTRVAVKQLESIAQGKKEFRAEVATIGSIHHVHLVQLKGFCTEGLHRLLVYEFMARGSLDKSLFTESTASSLHMDWGTRFNIALGTARGLAYLHEDCRERIIHCDIKPENILLDDNFAPKVSDFGLAKLMNREQSHVFTTLRGTRGYLAPEWLMNYPISEKSDVYSFGMVLLELISGRKNFDPTETSEKWYFPAYAFQQAEQRRWDSLVDPKLNNEFNDKDVAMVIQIALLCIQEEVPLRPSMGKVVQMLEGIVEVPYPPFSSQLAVRLNARMMDAVSEKDRSTASTDYSQDLISATQLSGPR